ncbi:hypothetical protein H0H92_000759 [Tricholoma furcatifolium]|nr:hypothetical protein H0H92_000759 [Tricholoma furcatifolium]
MHSTVLPEIPHHIPSPPTNEKLDFADLAIIDLAKYGTPEGNVELVQQVRDAMKTVGFFYVINHGYTLEQTRRTLDIAEIPFPVSDEEKEKYVANIKETGSYQGYKLRQYWVNHLLGNTELPGIDLRNTRSFATILAGNRGIRPIQPLQYPSSASETPDRLLALGLELPEATFTDIQGFATPLSEAWFRTMKYYPRTTEDEMKTNNVWLKGHTDTGSLTLLWSQPISGLQILDREGCWKWVKHIENAVVINAGMALQYLSGGFYRGTIHRVHQPPPDQAGLSRLTLIYFAAFNDDVRLVPLEHSPVLQRVGIIREIEDSLAPTMGDFRKGKYASYGQSTLKQGKDAGVEEEEVAGVIRNVFEVLASPEVRAIRTQHLTMQSTVLPEIPHHTPPPSTNEKLDFADLAIIDLAKYGTSEGNVELVQQVRNAMKTIGFFYVINHGYTLEQTRRMLDIAEIPFTVSDEEKEKYVANIKETGSYQGYKLRQYWVNHLLGNTELPGIDSTLLAFEVTIYQERIEVYSDVRAKEHPAALRPFLPEIEAFAQFNHFNILLPLLRLLALGLELPEATFTDIQGFATPLSESWIRAMKYQPVSGLQILDREGCWKWVKHIENAVVINAGMALQFLSGGFYKGTIHRVHQPPPDQAGHTRLTLIYFGVFNDDVKLVPLDHSPVLQRVGTIREIGDSLAPTMGAYRKGRIASYGQVALKQGKDAGVEEEEVAGVVVRHYN